MNSFIVVHNSLDTCVMSDNVYDLSAVGHAEYK